MILCFWVLTISLSALAGVNFAFSALETVEGDKTVISIEKPQTVDATVFLMQIDRTLETLNQDIMVRYIDVSGEKDHYVYFKTNHTTDFISIPVMVELVLPQQGSCSATSDLDLCSGSQLKLPDKYQSISFHNWYDAEAYDLSKANYLVMTSKTQEIASAIQSLGYLVQIDTGLTIYTQQLSPAVYILLPAFMFVVSAMFSSLANGKQNVLMKMEGYGTVQILGNEIRKNQRWALLSLLTIIGGTLLIAAVIFRITFIQFFLFYLCYLIYLIGILIVGGVFAALVVLFQNDAEYVKGKVPKKGMYLTTLLGKIVFLVFLLYSLSIGIRDIFSVIHSIRTLETISDRIENYVTIPINVSNASLSDPEKNYLAFYHLTVEDYEGVLIEASNYSYDVTTGSNLSIDLGQDFITINQNYLKLNPIYDVSGASISPESFSEIKYNILIPSSKLDEKEKYIEYIDLWYGMEVNFIEYEGMKSEIFSYNPGVGSDSLGRVDQPVILIFDESLPYSGAYIESYCSQGEYFLKTYTDDPYQELLPILAQSGIAPVSPKTPYVTDRFNEWTAFQLSSLRLYLTQSAFFLLGVVSLILFSVDLYCEINKQKIACSLIEGATIMGYMRAHFLMIGLSYLLTITVIVMAARMSSITVNYILLLGAIGLELLITVLTANKLAKRNLYQIVKGAE
ncbi:MAG TPA: hypothetical protein DF984_07190 [Anaerolineaceae bacterium]|jgi:hypothetical protein|nr:hypothetical protein [Anaerolineaceae bacterium]